MKFVDAHIYLSDPEYSDKISQLIEDAKCSNVIALSSNSMDLKLVKCMHVAQVIKGSWQNATPIS